jgi:hypothetical protein
LYFNASCEAKSEIKVSKFQKFQKMAHSPLKHAAGSFPTPHLSLQISQSSLIPKRATTFVSPTIYHTLIFHQSMILANDTSAESTSELF